jgi:hypothetical protein
MPMLVLDKIIMWTTPNLRKKGGCSPWFTIFQGGREVFDYSKEHQVVFRTGREMTEFSCNESQVIEDFKITFWDHDDNRQQDEMMFFVALHTGFITTNKLTLSRNEIDGASEDIKNVVYNADFKLELVFIPPSRSTRPRIRVLSALSEDVLHDFASCRARMEMSEDAANLKIQTTQAGAKARLQPLIRRFQQDGFDVDLTYITNNLIAMGLSETVTASSRSPIDEIALCIKSRHGQRYTIFHLPIEAGIDVKKFDGQVNDQFAFYKHQPPPLQFMVDFCEYLEKWLNEHSKNVAVISCASGKGRAGIMICSYLIYSQVFEDSERAMDYFAKQVAINE